MLNGNLSRETYSGWMDRGCEEFMALLHSIGFCEGLGRDAIMHWSIRLIKWMWGLTRDLGYTGFSVLN